MKKLILAMTFCFYFLITTVVYTQSGWLDKSLNTSSSFLSVYFVNQYTGWIVGEGERILKTTNGGDNWIQQTVFGFSNLMSIYCLNQDTCYAAGTSGKLLYTTNGGINWISYIGMGGALLTSINFYGPSNGYLCSAGLYDTGDIFKRDTNGYWSWNYSCNARFYSIIFVDSLNGYCGGSYDSLFKHYGIICKTTNAGVNWQKHLLAVDNELNSVVFPTVMTGYACGGYNGKIFKSSNSGSNWIAQFVTGNFSLNCIFAVNADTIYSVGSNGNILKTTNGGQNWYNSLTNINNSINSVFFINALTGYATGGNGLFLKTTNGGVPIGINPIFSEIPKAFSLSQNYPNPFNPFTKIKFDIPKSGDVKLVVYDVLGREVKTLLNEQLKPGMYEVEWNALNMPSGVYFYKLTTSDFTEIKRMVLVK